MKAKTVGFPMIHNFAGDDRDFMPELFAFMDRYEGVEFYLETGYGERLGYTAEDYLQASSKVHFVSFEQAYKQDITMILKNPDLENLEMLKDGSVLFTMLHYSTRPAVIELIKRKHIKSFSMDSIVDDSGLRMFVDYFGTAYEACKVGVQVLKETFDDFYSEERGPIKALIMGAGGVGQGAVKALEVLSDAEFLDKENVQGILTSVATRTITSHRGLMQKLLSEIDLLIDATQRKDQTVQLIPNEDVALLPKHAVIVDITADRYDFTMDPPLRRVIEGTVNGDPAHYIIYPDDALYDELPDEIDSTHRRVIVGCDAWPGKDSQRSVRYYFNLMKNYVGILLTKEPEEISENSDNLFERGLYRGTLKHFENTRRKQGKE